MSSQYVTKKRKRPIQILFILFLIIQVKLQAQASSITSSNDVATLRALGMSDSEIDSMFGTSADENIDILGGGGDSIEEDEYDDYDDDDNKEEEDDDIANNDDVDSEDEIENKFMTEARGGGDYAPIEADEYDDYDDYDIFDNNDNENNGNNIEDELENDFMVDARNNVNKNNNNNSFEQDQREEDMEELFQEDEYDDQDFDEEEEEDGLVQDENINSNDDSNNDNDDDDWWKDPFADFDNQQEEDDDEETIMNDDNNIESMNDDDNIDNNDISNDDTDDDFMFDEAEEQDNIDAIPSENNDNDNQDDFMLDKYEEQDDKVLNGDDEYDDLSQDESDEVEQDDDGNYNDNGVDVQQDEIGGDIEDDIADDISTYDDYDEDYDTDIDIDIGNDYEKGDNIEVEKDNVSAMQEEKGFLKEAESKISNGPDIVAASASSDDIQPTNKPRIVDKPIDNDIQVLKEAKSDETKVPDKPTTTTDKTPKSTENKLPSMDIKAPSSVSTAIPALLLPNMGRALVQSPLSVQLFAGLTVANIAFMRFGSFFKKNKVEEKENESLHEREDQHYDSEDVDGSEEESDLVEDLGFGRTIPVQRKRNIQLMDDDEDKTPEDPNPNPIQGKRNGIWGRKKGNEIIGQENTKKKAEPTPTREGRNLFGRKSPTKEDMEAQLDEIESLKKRSLEAEGAQEELENNYDVVVQRLKEAQKQLSEVNRTNNFLKNQLRDNKRVLERAVIAERQKTSTELARVRDQMVEVLERERRIMRAQLMKSSEEVRSMIANSDHHHDDDYYDDYDAGQI